MDETLKIEVRRLWEVEHLTMRQIAEKLRMGRRTVTRILRGETAKKPRKPSIIAPYERLIAEWYKTTPALMAIQVLNRLRDYGYTGGYGTVKQATAKFRKKRVAPVESLEELNAKVFSWQKERNLRLHRTTKRPPAEMLHEEKLRPLPRIDVRPYRRVSALATKTAFVEFETNRYSLPTAYAGLAVEILAFSDTMEILVRGRLRHVPPASGRLQRDSPFSCPRGQLAQGLQDQVRPQSSGVVRSQGAGHGPAPGRAFARDRL